MVKEIVRDVFFCLVDVIEKTENNNCI